MAGMEVRLEDYDYPLPPERIAQEPALHRDDARLLVLERGKPGLRLGRFGEIGSFLGKRDLLVLNDTRVFPARLRARRRTGGRVEVFLVEDLPGEPGRWRALLGPAKAGRSGRALTLEEAPEVEVRPLREEEGGRGRFVVELARGGRLLDPGEVMALCEEVGEVPLPPYIERNRGDHRGVLDRARYQTVYARVPGSVAAPTAGLHFTAELLEKLRARGIETASVTLTVGPGTFQPLREEVLRSGKLFSEAVTVPAGTAERVLAARGEGRRVVAVGTTSARALESWALAGAPRLAEGWSARTDLLIAPGHRFQLVGGLLTNFHLPRSSLLLLVCAFAGRERILEAYRRAIEEGFRFYSYGDAMMIV